MDGSPADYLVDVTVPVYNEAKVITIADNASTDETFAIATRMGEELTGVRVVHLDRKGRGLALRHVWASRASCSSW